MSLKTRRGRVPWSRELVGLSREQRGPEAPERNEASGFLPEMSLWVVLIKVVPLR